MISSARPVVERKEDFESGVAGTVKVMGKEGDGWWEAWNTNAHRDALTDCTFFILHDGSLMGLRPSTERGSNAIAAGR